MQNTTTGDLSQYPQMTWCYRRWLEQAERLYPGNALQQDFAIAQHLRVCLAHAKNPARRAWLETLGRRLLLEGR
jgi:hypothetical protein